MRRREFLGGIAGIALSSGCAGSAPAPQRGPSRVVVIRHDSLVSAAPQAARVRELLDEAAAALRGVGKPVDAWATIFRQTDSIGIKVNCLGHATRPAIAEATVACIAPALIPGAGPIIWDRQNTELKSKGYEIREAGGRGPRCFGTDALGARGNAGYSDEIHSSGAIGSLFSRIVTEETTALVSMPVLKDHNLAGLSGGMKNFYGAIHNPNKYHDNGCDPFVADVCAAPVLRDRLRLVIIDATRPQFNGGPSLRPDWQWPYGGLIIGVDPVAVDRVALEILSRKRAVAGMPSLEAAKRPAGYLLSAAARGLGMADLARIEVVSIGRKWTDV